MPKAFQLSVVAPDRTVFEGSVVSVVAPGAAGYLGVMADHEATIVALRSGVVELMGADNQREHIAIGPGFLEVSHGRCVVLSEEARIAHEIDVAQEQALLEEARKALRGEASRLSVEQASQEMERAVSRLRAARRV
jgi:ATP synthase, F1 epsilon subunit (delta in mitochondria)